MNRKFNPLIFLASLGAGGISVIPFSFLQYTHHRGEGLITFQQVGHGSLSIGKEILFFGLESVMLLFAAIHIILTILLIGKLVKWVRGEEYRSFISDPLINTGILAPFISFAMTMNVFIGPVRFFIPSFAQNLQFFMLPALAVFTVIWAFLMKMEIGILKTAFATSFDVSRLHFGWLLQPFALAMITVTGTGIAAMAKNPSVAHTAAFLSFVSGSMGFFLFMVKLFSLFKSHFEAPGLPDRQFLPGFLIVVPNITLYAISAFRLGHYFEHQFGAHLHIYFTVVILTAFAFESWYMMFGLSLLSDYFRKHFFSREFYISQWGLVCPFVAYAVLSAFVYSVFINSVVFYVLVITAAGVSIALFAILIRRQLACAGMSFKENPGCVQQPALNS